MMLVPRKNFDFIEDFFNDPFFDSNDSKVMKTDIKEHENNYELIIELPGYAKENIKMSIEDGYLVVNASVDSEKEETNSVGKFVRKERYYGECSRSFYIGDNVCEEDIKASFRNGVLNIEIPKIEENEKNIEKKYIEIN